MAHLIEVSPDESISSIRAKLAAGEERDAIMLVPRHTRALQTVVGGRVLARAVNEYRLRLAIVTRDGAVRDQLSQAGFSVFNQVSAAENAKRWRSPAEPEAATRAPAKVHRTVAEGRRPEQRSWPERLLGLALLLVLLFAVAAFSVLLIPEATVEVRPATQMLVAEVRLSVLPGLEKLDYERVAIPGRTVSTLVQGTWSQPTMSRMDTADARATGTVLFINQLTSSITIPAGTVISTGAGTPVRFRTTADVQLPEGKSSTVAAPVEAVDPGPGGNVAAYLINTMQGPLATQVTVISEQPTSGGSVRQVGVVTEADRARLRDGLLQRLGSEGHNALQSLIEPGEVAPRETLRLSREFPEAWDKMLNEAADQLTLTMRVEYVETAFKTSDVTSIALAGLKGVVPEGFHLASNEINFEVTSVQADAEGNMALVLTTRGQAVAELDAGELRALVQGATPDEARQLLASLPLAEPASIALTPDWIDTLPRFGFRVHVRVLPPQAPS